MVDRQDTLAKLWRVKHGSDAYMRVVLDPRIERVDFAVAHEARKVECYALTDTCAYFRVRIAPDDGRVILEPV